MNKTVAAEIDSETLRLIEDYLIEVKYKGRCENTINSYRSSLIWFFKHFNKPFNEITREDVYCWLENYVIGKKPSTINCMLTKISCFFMYACKEEYISKSPISKRWRKKIPKPVPKYIPQNEIAKIKVASETESLRNRTIIEFFLATAVRSAELRNLKVSDVDIEGRSATVLGKGNKQRIVHFNDKCAFLLQELITQNPPDKSTIFLNKYGETISQKRIYQIVRNIGIKLNIQGRLYPHRFRHTWATVNRSKGADSPFLQAQLGHANPDVTAMYSPVLDSDIINAYRKAMD